MKGLSQLITTVLILAISVAVAGVYANWAPNFAEDATKRVAEQQDRDMKCRNADFSILEAEYDLSGNFTDIELLNTGTIDFNQDLEAYTINNSRIINRSIITGLEVDENRTIRVYSNELPEETTVISRECTDLERTQKIQTRN